MKKVLYIFIFSIPLVTMGQKIDRTKAPAPGKAPIIQVASPVKYTLANGLQVFVVKNTKLPRVTATLAFDLDGFKEGEKAGMAEMAGQLLKRGTQQKSKVALDEAIEYLGGSLTTSSTSASASALKNNFPKLMELMAEVVFHPALAPAELEKIRKQTLSGIESSKDDPDAISEKVVKKLVYGANHPFGEIETKQSVSAVTVEDVKHFLENYWKPNIAYLVFVGDIEPLVAKSLAERHFGHWKSGAVKNPIATLPTRPSTYVAVVDRPASVQSVVTIATTVDLKPGGPSAIASSVMNNILGGGFSGRLFANLREKHAFTYGAYSSLSPNRQVGFFSAEASVRNEKTDSAIQEILHEINVIRNEKVGDTELIRMKNYLAGGFARSLENPMTIASFALNIARYKMPSDYYQKYLTHLAAIDADNVKTIAKTLINPSQLHIVIVGNAKEIAKGLDKYGPIRYFDVEGNEISAPSEAKADLSITPNQLMEKAINAVGGKESIALIKDLQLKGTVTVMGQSLEMTQTLITPGNAVLTMSMQGMIISKQSILDGKYSVTQQGMETPVNEEVKEGLDESACIAAEQLFLTKGYTLKIVGAEKVDGKDAIKVEVKSPAGKLTHRFYDATSFLLVKTSESQEVPGRGPITKQQFYNNYQTVSGVKVATEQLLDLGQMKMTVKFVDIKANQGLKTTDIK